MWAFISHPFSPPSPLHPFMSLPSPFFTPPLEQLFGRKKGSGESLGSIKKQLGMLSTGLHMQYTSFAGKGQTDPDHIDHTKSAPAANGNGNRARQDPAPTVTCAEVVYSGFFDSIGLVRCSSC